MQYMWNTYTGALLKLDQAAQEYVKSFSGDDDNSIEFRLLKDNGFVVCQQLDEYGRVLIEEKQGLFNPNSDHLHIVIVPGMGCNYRCSYCFESKSDLTGIMTPEIAVDVAEYVCEQMQSNSNIKSLQVIWFGGEPLLYVDTMENISRKIIEYTQKNGIKYSAWMVTNGRFLDKDTLERLKAIVVEKAQITVDGLCDVYCKSKGASPDDFEIVIDNICHTVEKGGLGISLNILNNNATEAIRITDYLLKQRNLIGKIQVFFHQILDYCQPPDISKPEYDDYINNFFQWANYMIEEYGLSEIKHMFRKRKTTACELVKVNNVCIGPRGEIYKCFRHAGVEPMIMGDIWGSRYFNEAESVFYSSVDDPAKQECSKCECLPLCMGDCQAFRVNKFERYNCEAHKKTMLKLKLLEGGVSI